jgi:hypothetical protein
VVSFIREFWMFLRVRKKYWFNSDFDYNSFFRGTDRSDARLSRGAFHIYPFLN